MDVPFFLFLFALGMRCESKDDKQNIFAAATVVTIAKRRLVGGRYSLYLI